MNTISNTGHIMAMDGQNYYKSVSKTVPPKQEVNPKLEGSIPNTAAEVSENISNNIAEAKSRIEELQKLSDLVMKNNKISFDVNKELNEIIIKVVDSSTKEVIREIPSEDLQRIQARMKQAVGLIFDKTV